MSSPPRFEQRIFSRFLDASKPFVAVFPWLWFVGMALIVVGIVAGAGMTAVKWVCILLIYPLLIGWFGITGAALIWSGIRNLVWGERSTWVFVAVFLCLLTGATFAYGCWVFLRMEWKVIAG